MVLNGINIKYTELCSLSLLQPFYINMYCRKYSIEPIPDFELLPTNECKGIMKKLNFICKNNPVKAGIQILSQVLGKNTGGNDLLRFIPSKYDKLSFWILVRNPDVFNFNDLPLSTQNQDLFYFTNQLNDPSAQRNDLHLSFSSGGANKTADTISGSGSFYKYHHSASVQPGTSKVKHFITGSEIPAASISNQAGESDIYFDLSTLPLGKCKLLINNIEKDIFYHTGSDTLQHIFGVIELSLSTITLANYRMLETDNSLTDVRPAYKVRFPNRPTLWRYTLELGANSPLFLLLDSLTPPLLKADFLNRLNVVTNDTAITFTKTYSSPDGRRFQFVSDNPILLREKYYSSSSPTNESLNLSLKKWVGIPGEASVKSDLQIPSMGNIDASNDPLIYTDIFLTI